MMKILILNGPNINQLEKRESGNYGSLSLKEISDSLRTEFSDVDFNFFQSNSEGELIGAVQDAVNYDGIIINPGGLTHTSVGLRDALEMLAIPKIEVHLSNLSSREDFRKNLITTSRVSGYVSGFKDISYSAAVYALKKLIQKKQY